MKKNTIKFGTKFNNESRELVIREIINPVLSGTAVVFQIKQKSGSSGWFQLIQQPNRDFLWGCPTIELAGPFGLVGIYPIKTSETFPEMFQMNIFEDSSEVDIYYITSNESFSIVLSHLAQDILSTTKTTFAVSEDRDRINGRIDLNDGTGNAIIEIDRFGNVVVEISGDTEEIFYYDRFFCNASETVSRFAKLFRIIGEKFYSDNI